MFGVRRAFGRLLDRFTPKPETFSRKDSLRGVPVLAQGVSSESGPEGERVIYVPRRSPFRGFLTRWLPTEEPPARFFLDDLGEAVFRRIDGKRTVDGIVKEFVEETGLHRREAEASVVAFLNMLMKRGVILVVIP